MTKMQYYQYSYTDVDGVQRVQVNVDGFGPMLSARGATQIEQTPMTDKQVKAYIRNSNKA